MNGEGEIGDQIRQLASLEDQILRQNTAFSSDTFNEPDSDDTISPGDVYSYASLAAFVVKKKFIDQYKSSYTMLCNMYLKKSTEDLNAAISKYVQLTRAKVYDSTRKEKQRHKDEEERELAYNQSKQEFENSENSFKRFFRDKYSENMGVLDKLLRDYQLMIGSSLKQDPVTFKQFWELRAARIKIRTMIDLHIFQMANLVGVNATMAGTRP